MRRTRATSSADAGIRGLVASRASASPDRLERPGGGPVARAGRPSACAPRPVGLGQVIDRRAHAQQEDVAQAAEQLLAEHSGIAARRLTAAATAARAPPVSRSARASTSVVERLAAVGRRRPTAATWSSADSVSRAEPAAGSQHVSIGLGVDLEPGVLR